MSTWKLRINIEERVRIEGNLRNELEAVKVSILFINPVLGIMRCSNLWPRQCDINGNC